MQKNNTILSGFGNYFTSEAINGALPLNQNSPQKVPFGLYSEQISGSAFTNPREENFKTWCYRLQPSVTHGEFKLLQPNKLMKTHTPPSPNQIRFSPFPMPKTKTDFLEGLTPVATNKKACIYIYTANANMTNRFFYNADGECLFIPELGEITLKTELGTLCVSAGEIALIPKGIIFQVMTNNARGYLCENQGRRFNLPGLGPIGANGLANPHDFIYPNASFEEKEGDFELICKYENHLWHCPIDHSPLNVVAFKGNYLPYQYDLARFNTINSVSFDHPDPSIFTVLTSASSTQGTANIDFVIFPARWMVAENTFRPPYFHRNPMSEFMGLVKGEYDAKKDGFEPGGFSIHNCMSAHGPDADTYQAAIYASLKPERYKDTLAFMLESKRGWRLTEAAIKTGLQQSKYHDCWQGLSKQFKR